MTDHHRKIELQSPEDLTYLITNIRTAALRKINLDLPPPSPSSAPLPDPFRERVEELVNAYIDNVFVSSAENVSINGMPVTPAMIRGLLDQGGKGEEGGKGKEREVVEYEAFDARQWERAKELARQEEDLVEEIARLRRRTPGAVVERVRGGWKGVEGDEEVLRNKEEKIVESEKKVRDLGVVELERQGEVEGSWKGAVEGLGRLRRTLPEMVAKKERAERAENYVNGKEGR